MIMINDLDRFHLVMDVIDRVPALGSRRRRTSDSRWSDARLSARAYTREHGEDDPAISGWTGTHVRREPRPDRFGRPRPTGNAPGPLRRDWLRLATPTSDAAPFSPGLLDGLPGPARRWLTRAIAPGTPLRRAALLRHTTACFDTVPAIGHPGRGGCAHQLGVAAGLLEAGLVARLRQRPRRGERRNSTGRSCPLCRSVVT